MSSFKEAPARLWARAGQVFADKEIFLRNQGKVRFLRISSRVQIAATVGLGALTLGWAAAAGNMIWQHLSLASDQAAIDARARSIAAEARKVNAYKRSVNEIADDLSRRQDLLDDMVRSQFGGNSSVPEVIGPDDNTKATPPSPSKKLSAVDQLRAMEARQTEFAQRLVTLVNDRASKAEEAIRSFGLRPEQVAARTARSAQGGPFIPWSAEGLDEDDTLTRLADALARLNALELGLISIPSGSPTTSPMLSSSYGYRSDPFNGHAAFHAGLDFPGRYGQPILAAAAGRISYVGQRQGYGNVVEVDHGNGIMTRYAHLSGFNARMGQTVPRGATIAHMGSTGRSTGTHLHFEVRVNGAPINPRRFLEVKDDVLEIQQIAKQRFARLGGISQREANSRG